MAQAGLHVPAAVATLPVFRSVFADIGDEQSISASLSTFSAHITNIVSMDRVMETPALVLLDEVGTGTDPNEGGALATAIVSHFKQRGALVIATTHYDALKTWGTATDGVMTAAFAFDPQTFAPTYRVDLRRARPQPGDRDRAAARHAADGGRRRRAGSSATTRSGSRRIWRASMRRRERSNPIGRGCSATGARSTKRAPGSRERERTLAEREERFTRRLNEKLDDRVRQAQRDIDQVIAQLKDRSEALIEQVAVRQRTTGISTGDTGAARSEAREAIGRIVDQLKTGEGNRPAGSEGPGFSRGISG